MGEFHLICGSDSFAVKEKARERIEALCGTDFASNPELEILDGSEKKYEEVFSALLSALRTPPFLSPRQVVWMRNFTFFDQLGKDDACAVDLLNVLLAPLPEYQTLVISGDAPDFRKSAGKKLKTAANVLLLNAAGAADRDFAAGRLMQIRQFGENCGKRIAADAAQYLSENLGGDSGVLFNELEKLRCYVGDRPEITLRDCRDVSAHTPEAVIWNFTGALVERNAREALPLLDALLEQGGAEIQLAAAISSEFQRLIQTRSAMIELGIGGRLNPRTFDSLDPAVRAANAENFLLKLHPYRAFKMCESAARWSREDLVRALRSATAANKALVTGAGEPRIVLEQLVLALCR